MSGIPSNFAPRNKKTDTRVKWIPGNTYKVGREDYPHIIDRKVSERLTIPTINKSGKDNTMKTKTILTIALLSIASFISGATQGNRTFTIKTTRVSKRLVESWVTAYKASHPDVNIVIVDKADEANLTITSNNADKSAIHVGRFALLPVTSVDNPLYNEVARKTWSENDLKRLFFQTDDDLLQAESEKTRIEKLADNLTIFSGSSSNSAAQTFAEHFGFTKGDIRGKRIAGDDLYLLNAIKRDKQSVTFSNLAYLFDLDSRRLKEGLAILPLNVRKSQSASLISENIDETIKFLEETETSTIPVENIAFVQNTFNNDIEDFLTWVVTEGQQYNNKAGFLRLGEKDAKKQLELLASK